MPGQQHELLFGIGLIYGVGTGEFQRKCQCERKCYGGYGGYDGSYDGGIDDAECGGCKGDYVGWWRWCRGDVGGASCLLVIALRRACREILYSQKSEVESRLGIMRLILW